LGNKSPLRNGEVKEGEEGCGEFAAQKGQVYPAGVSLVNKLGSNCTFGLLLLGHFSFVCSGIQLLLLIQVYIHGNIRVSQNKCSLQAKITPFGNPPQFPSPLPVNPIILLFLKRFDEWDDLRLRASMICLMSRS